MSYKKDVDESLRSLGYDPKEVAVRGEVLVAALIKNAELRSENAALTARVKELESRQTMTLSVDAEACAALMADQKAENVLLRAQVEKMRGAMEKKNVLIGVIGVYLSRINSVLIPAGRPTDLEEVARKLTLDAIHTIEPCAGPCDRCVALSTPPAPADDVAATEKPCPKSYEEFLSLSDDEKMRLVGPKPAALRPSPRKP